MIVAYQCVNIKYDKVSGALNKNWQAKGDLGSNAKCPLGLEYVFSGAPERELKDNCPFTKM